MRDLPPTMQKSYCGLNRLSPGAPAKGSLEKSGGVAATSRECRHEASIASVLRCIPVLMSLGGWSMPGPRQVCRSNMVNDQQLHVPGRGGLYVRAYTAWSAHGISLHGHIPYPMAGLHCASKSLSLAFSWHAFRLSYHPRSEPAHPIEADQYSTMCQQHRQERPSWLSSSMRSTVRAVAIPD